MKKKIVYLVVMVVTSMAANALPKVPKLPKFLLAAHTLYAQPEEPIFKESYKFGLGADVEAGFGFGKTLLTGTVGYTYFAKNQDYLSGLNYVPVRLGIRRYFIAGLFANVGTGYAFINAPAKTTISGSTTYTFDKLSESNWMAEGGLGYKLLGFEMIANYGGWQDKNSPNNHWNSSFIFKLGYSIKIK